MAMRTASAATTRIKVRTLSRGRVMGFSSQDFTSLAGSHSQPGQTSGSMHRCLSRDRPGRGLLLGQAVEGSQTPDEVDRVDADDLAIRERGGQNGEGLAVARVVEGRHQNHPVGNVKVRIARRQPCPLEDDRPGHRQLDDLERLAVLVSRGLQAFEVRPERLVILVRRILLDDKDHGRRVDEPGQVIDMPVGVVAGDPFVEPDDMRRGEMIREHLLDLRAGKAEGCGPGRRSAGIPRWSARSLDR